MPRPCVPFAGEASSRHRRLSDLRPYHHTLLHPNRRPRRGSGWVGPIRRNPVFHFTKQVNVGARHTGMGNVAADRDCQAVAGGPFHAGSSGHPAMPASGVHGGRHRRSAPRSSPFPPAGSPHPKWGWRTTIRSGCMAFRVSAVSIRVFALF